MDVISIRTSRRHEMLNITARIEEVLRKQSITEGVVTIYVPHTTAGITINENADPDVVHDILLTLEALVPQDRPGYQHGEGNSDAHVKASMMGSSVQVIVAEGKPQLGTWQCVYFCEFDGPRSRTVWIQISGK